jgi:hypothetical protein
MKMPTITIPSWMKKRWIRWERHIEISKRQQFILVTFFLTLILVLTQLISLEYIRYPLVVLLAAITYVGSAFCLREDLEGVEWFTLLIPLTLYSAAVALFYFLLPARWLTRIPVAFLYAVGLYGYLLTQNIYNVAANRTIALLRAARSVGFLLTILTFYLLVLTILSFRSYPILNSLWIGLIGWLHIFPALWSVELMEKASGKVVSISIALAVILAELAWAFSMWPMPTTMIALLLSSVFYSTVGMGQEYLAQKLYRKTIIEFISVCVIVFLAAMLTTRWRGI